jgi:hypothetical protein
MLWGLELKGNATRIDYNKPMLASMRSRVSVPVKAIYRQLRRDKTWLLD